MAAMFSGLVPAGHLTIFLARTRDPFWSVRPARLLLAAVLGTQLLANEAHGTVREAEPGPVRDRPGEAAATAKPALFRTP